MSHSIIITNWKRRALLFVTSLLGAILLGGCGLLNVTHLVPTTGQVLDVSTAEPKPVADAWVRLAWGHNTICLNPVQPCSRPVCDKVEAVQTNSSGKFRVWGVPWQGLIYSLWLTEGSQNLGVLAPGYVNLYSVGKLEEKYVLLREWRNEHGQMARESRTDYIPAMQAGYEQYAELYKKMTQRPSSERNDIWLVPDRAAANARAGTVMASWFGNTGCELSRHDTAPLKSGLVSVVKTGAERSSTLELRRSIAASTIISPSTTMSGIMILEPDSKLERDVNRIAEELP
jgi:hypothetical protein